VRWRAELSDEAQEQLERCPRNVRDRISRAIDEFEAADNSPWRNIKALQGGNGRGGCASGSAGNRIIFRKVAARGVVEISAILIKSKNTYR
jgi:mRNA-degrading endonuclease RelE of RelBE toxin-antitoxin system